MGGSLTLNLLKSCLVSKPQESTCLSLSHMAIGLQTDTTIPSFFLKKKNMGLEHMSSCLQDKHITNGAIVLCHLYFAVHSTRTN